MGRASSLLPRRGGGGRALAALFLFGLSLFLPPVLVLFMSPVTVFGLPLSFLYVLSAWIVFVGVLAWLCEWRVG